MTTLFCVHIHTKFPQGGGYVRLSKPVESRGSMSRSLVPPPAVPRLSTTSSKKERRVLGDRTYASSQLVDRLRGRYCQVDGVWLAYELRVGCHRDQNSCGNGWQRARAGD
jgi:hypothetical protein